MSKPYIFYIDGMSCISCSNVIETHLRKTSIVPIEYFYVDLTTPDPKKTTIILNEELSDHQVQWEHLKSTIEQKGFECKTSSYKPDNILIEKVNPPKLSRWDKVKQITTSHWFLGTLGSTIGIGFLITFLAASALPISAMIALASLSTILTFIIGAHSYKEAWKKLMKSKTLTMDSLFAISTLTVLAVSISSFFIPWLPMMFEASLLIYGFRHLGLAIEETLKEKITSANFQDRAPTTVRLVLKSGIHCMPLTYIKPKDIIEIAPGEVVPLDSYCSTQSLIYNTIISGSTLPRLYSQGEKVLAGMRLAKNAPPLRMQVINDASNSFLSRLDKGIAQSIHEKAPLELKTQKLLSYFIPTVIGLAVLSGLIIGLFFPAAIAIQCAVSVLVSACPCTLGLIIPLAVKTGIHKAAEYGVHFKNSKALQEMDQIDTLIFDLNGTLTTGVPTVKQHTVVNKKINLDQLLAISAALENGSPHPVAKAIYTFTQQYKLPPIKVRDHNATHHSGIFAMLNEARYAIGSLGFMKDQGVSIVDVDRELSLDAGDSVVYVARNSELVGYFIVTDPLRDDALRTINVLKSMGKDLHICTGSDEKTAQRYARSLGINQVYADSVATSLEPGDKSKPDYIKQLQKKNKKVAMVGDAANDVRALAASDLGIAMLSHNADELTQQHAGAVIQNGTLMPIANALAVSQQTVKNISQNLLMSLGYNLSTVLFSGGLLVAAGFIMNPAIGAALMVIQACLVLLNVYRFKQKGIAHLTHTQECTVTKAIPDFYTPQQSSYQFTTIASPANSADADRSNSYTRLFKPCYEDDEPAVIVTKTRQQDYVAIS